MGALIDKYQIDNRNFPDSLADIGQGALLDPWGHPYQYVNHNEPNTRGLWRRDKNIVPINSDFDVFSMGKDGASRPPLTAAASRDDIVRANNGAFIGLASDYDP
jgi:general secretion pathway protein G